MRNLARAPWPYGYADALDLRPRWSSTRAFPISSSSPGEGVIGIIRIGEQAGAVEIGYWIASSYWGRGFATEAARAL